jgi:hypothetical protein
VWLWALINGNIILCWVPLLVIYFDKNSDKKGLSSNIEMFLHFSRSDREDTQNVNNVIT